MELMKGWLRAINKFVKENEQKYKCTKITYDKIDEHATRELRRSYIETLTVTFWKISQGGQHNIVSLYDYMGVTYLYNDDLMVRTRK